MTGRRKGKDGTQNTPGENNESIVNPLALLAFNTTHTFHLFGPLAISFSLHAHHLSAPLFSILARISGLFHCIRAHRRPLLPSSLCSLHTFFVVDFPRKRR